MQLSFPIDMRSPSSPVTHHTSFVKENNLSILNMNTKSVSHCYILQCYILYLQYLYTSPCPERV